MGTEILDLVPLGAQEIDHRPLQRKSSVIAANS
jgi:hypothetical protein